MIRPSDEDILGCFYDLLDGYFVVHEACGKAVKGVPSMTDPDAGFLQCPFGCPGN